MFIASRFPLVLVFGIPVFAASVPGIENFDQVDARVYRGAQPGDRGFQYLADLGVKTVIDLRESGSRSRAEERAVKAAGMAYINVPMSGFTPPTEIEITKLLTLMGNPAASPVFVHCRRGADRTGAVIAAYRIHYLQWDNARALADAKAHRMSMFEIPRQNYIRKFRPLALDAATKAPAETAVAAGAAN